VERDNTPNRGYQDEWRRSAEPRRRGQRGSSANREAGRYQGKEPLWPPEERPRGGSRRRAQRPAEADGSQDFPEPPYQPARGYESRPSHRSGPRSNASDGWDEAPEDSWRPGHSMARFAEDERTLPEGPFADDDHSAGFGHSRANSRLHTDEAERWGGRARSAAPSKHLRGIRGLWQRYGTTGPRRAVIITLLVAIVLCSISSLITSAMAYSTGSSAYHQASDGLTHLRAGERLLLGLSNSGFSVAAVQQARSEFATAQQDFAQANESLHRIPGIAESAPLVGGKLRTVNSLAAVADNFSQIGVAACDALAIALGALSNPFGTSKSGSSNTSSSASSTTPKAGLTANDLATIQAKLATISALFNDTTAQLNALQPGDLSSFDPKIGAEMMKVKAALPTIQQSLQEAQAVMGIAGSLLGVGTPTNYLVELLDSTELRPGGGFIGNIGIMTLNSGLLASLHVKDVDLLDRPFEFAGGFIPFPSQYRWFDLVSNWSVRDSNLDGDFPTDARNAETNYRLEGGTEKVQGVIAITPWLIERALAITGPIYVPEFKETVTPSNLVNLIHYHQLGPGHGSEYVPDPASLSSERKRFTGFLFMHFMDRVKAIMGAKRSEFVKLAMTALSTKDVQIYFNNPVVEQLLQRHSLASTIDAPPTGDSLFVVDANVAGNKANNFITYNMADKVVIDENGTATHQLSLTYKWPQSAASQANNYGNTSYYRDYVRVYVPPKATLISQSGWAYIGQSKAFGRLVFAGYLSLWYGGSQTITIKWRVPDAAVKNGDAWTYQELLQHQAGITWTASMQITPQACGQVTSVTAPWQIASDRTNATFKGKLTMDKVYSTSYSCTAK
jgi:hypothetical protein